MHVKSQPIEPRTPTLAEFIKPQSVDAFGQQAEKHIGYSETGSSLNKDGVLIRSLLIDGALQELVLQSTRQRILYLSQYRSVAGHPEQQYIYETMPRDYYWPNMAQIKHGTGRIWNRMCIKL